MDVLTGKVPTRSSERPAPKLLEHKAVFWWILLVGVIIRLATLAQPVFNNSNLRQTQTATLTQSLLAEGGRTLAGQVTWMGDLPARLLLELPLYNYLVLAAHKVIGNLDVSGKLVSVLLWGLSFALVQSIWRRFLNQEETFWANFLFAAAPLSVFFGQAFLPEMLIQSISLGFVALLLKYLEQDSRWLFAGLASLGALGMLLKAPEVSHLYLLAGVAIGCKERRAALGRIRYWVALLATLAAMRVWSGYIDRTNGSYFAEWTSSKVVELMVGPWLEHVRPFGYLRIAIYLISFVTTAGGLAWTLIGLNEVLRYQRQVFLLAWLGSLVFFYVFWAGLTSRVHCYYNLPALGPACILFGIGCGRWLGGAARPNHSFGARLAIAALVVGTAIVPYAFLYHNDPVLTEATAWLRQHTAPEDLVLVRINHRTDMCQYRHNSTVAYYAQRRIWCWVDAQTQEQRQRALLTSKWALVTHPVPQVGVLEHLRRWAKQMQPIVQDMSWLEKTGGFAKVYQSADFTVYQKKS